MIRPIPCNFNWSFSKLSAFETCPCSFALQYLHDPPLPQQQNAWAEYGILCHSLLEEYAKGELPANQLTAEYKSRYPDVVIHNFPPYPKGYAEKAFQQGIDYFDSFTGFGDQFEVVSTEEKFRIDIGPYGFVGISDLVLRDRNTDELVVIDHKTKSESSMKNELDLYKKQLYIYAEHVRQKYGKFPSSIQFNMIKGQEPIVEVFSEEKHRETLQWAESTIDEIYFEDTWEPRPNQYYCRYICPVFQHCTAGMKACEIPKKKKK
jgi:predicted RecB family nuclease